MIRRQVRKCCDWCASLAGIYEKGKEPADVYKRHENCKCMVTFKSGKGTYTNVWSKKEFQTQKEARISNEKRIEREIDYNSRQRKMGELLEKEVDTPKVSSYHISPKLMQELENSYDTSISKGMISPLVGFDTYLKDYIWIQNNLIGQTTSNGIKITGQSRHLLERRYGTQKDLARYQKNGEPVKREGVTLGAIQDALLNGKIGKSRTSKKGQESVALFNTECMVTVNTKTGKIIQCNRK